jgi:16S rRNA (guanine966-N2)-methyltransferase
MGDRVRSALFNMIDVRDAVVLDAFAGTGALGLEALSRGATHVTFIERDRTAAQVIDDNITTLNVRDRTKLIKTSVANYMSTVNDAKFDVILADPPYHNPQFSTALSLAGYLKLNGLMILSYSAGLCVPTVNGVVVVDNRSYGEAALAILRFDKNRI